MLLRLWSNQPYRTTRDLDLLRKGDGSFDAIRSDIRGICAVPVEPDAVVFDSDAVRLEAIRAEDEYGGTRATLLARCGRARLTLQIDMGFGDSVWPAPQPCVYPTLLEFPPPRVLAYPREAVAAEKLEAMVVLGDRNSRIKDFFDLHYLASRFEFDRATLAEAVRRTFVRRRTPHSHRGADRPDSPVLGESGASRAGAGVRTPRGTRDLRCAWRRVPPTARCVPEPDPR